MSEDLNRVNLLEWSARLQDLSGTKRHLFEDSEFWTFLTWGPNQRTVFHVNPADEMFQQLAGEMELHYLRPNGEHKLAMLKAGDLLVVPAGVPHSPRRGPGSCTLVITLKRSAAAAEAWIWCCAQCHARLHEVGMAGRRQGESVDVLSEGTRALQENATLRTCTRCGHCSEI